MKKLNPNLTQPEIQNFIRNSQTQDFRKISLRNSPFEHVSSSELAEQIKGLQIAKSKFPSYYETENIIYPPTLNLEQTSSEVAANYKAKIISGKFIADLTSGFGIDSFAFAQNFQKVISIEKSEELTEIVRHNLKQLNVENIEIITSDFKIFLHQNPDLKLDWIYIDPSRRKGSQRKFKIEDLEPDVLNELPLFFTHSNQILIKFSPLLDLSEAIQKLKFVNEIHIVAVKNEVKEVLLLCGKPENSNPKIHCVNLKTNQNDFEFYKNQEAETEAEFSIPLQLIYEPNSAILKAGAFKLIGRKFNLKKLHPNTHLYTSNELIPDFPGKIYEVESKIENPKKQIRNGKFHLLAKNYPMKTDEIRKKFQIQDTEELSLIFTKSIDGNHILKAKRIQ